MRLCEICNKNKPLHYFPDDAVACLICTGEYTQRFIRANYTLNTDYIYELGAGIKELNSEDLEWWLIDTNDTPPSFSIPLKNQWFICKGCGVGFDKSHKYRGDRRLCRPCGRKENSALSGAAHQRMRDKLKENTSQ